MKKIRIVPFSAILALLGGCLAVDTAPQEAPGPSDTTTVVTDTTRPVDTLTGPDTLTVIDTLSPGDTTRPVTPPLDTAAIRASLDSIDFRAAFWPMVAGNSWTYVDSTFSEQGAFVKADTFTLSLTGKHYDYEARQVWWSFSGGGPIPFPQTGPASSLFLMQRRDSIFSKEFNNFDPTFLVQAKLIALPVSRDTFGYSWAYGGDVGITMKAIRSPAAYATPA